MSSQVWAKGALMFYISECLGCRRLLPLTKRRTSLDVGCRGFHYLDADHALGSGESFKAVSPTAHASGDLVVGGLTESAQERQGGLCIAIPTCYVEQSLPRRRC